MVKNSLAVRLLAVRPPSLKSLPNLPNFNPTPNPNPPPHLTLNLPILGGA